MAGLVKGCPMPALMPQTYQDAPDRWAGVGQASREETAECPGVVRGLEGYGDLIVRSRAACGNRAGRAQSVIARMSDGAEARLDSWRTQRARNAVTVREAKPSVIGVGR